MQVNAILSTLNKLPIVIKIFVLSAFEWPFYIGFTVHKNQNINYFPYFLTKEYVVALWVLYSFLASHFYHLLIIFANLEPDQD